MKLVHEGRDYDPDILIAHMVKNEEPFTIVKGEINVRDLASVIFLAPEVLGSIIEDNGVETMNLNGDQMEALKNFFRDAYTDSFDEFFNLLEEEEAKID